MNPPVTAYPLAWPTGWKRTRTREVGRFSRKGYSRDANSSYRPTEDISIADATGRLLGELERMGIRQANIIISSNLLLRQDGLPRSGQAQPTDPGVAVYWKDSRVDGWPQRCMAIDRYTKVEQNIAALAATIDAMRAIERHGGAAILDRAFTGFLALPAPMVVSRSWRQVLGLENHSWVTLSDVEDAYRRARSEAHPDKNNGSSAKFDEVVKAHEAAIRELREDAQRIGGLR